MAYIPASGYQRNNHNPSVFNERVQKTTVCLTEYRRKHPFDAIVVRGVSGAAIGYPVAYLTGIPIINVRKPGTESHSGYTLEGPDDSVEKYVILDDFICGGGTVEAIMSEMERYGVERKGCVAICLYDDPVTSYICKDTPIIKPC